MADEPKPIIDAFGEPRSEDGKIIPPPAPVVEEPKKPEGKEGTGKQPEAADIENHPVVKDLMEKVTKLQTDKGSMGKNLSDQGKIIKEAQDEIKRLKNGGDAKPKPLFEDIKRVKDLPKAQVDEMTDAEKTLFDALADTREQMNKMVIDAQQQRQEGETDAQKRETEAQAQKDADKAKGEFDKKAQTAAKKLAGTDTELANKIIENFNLFKDNEALDDDGLAERMQAAARMIPTYTPPKQGSATGGGTGSAVKDAAAGDQFGTEDIIKQAQGQDRGRYQL
jgi:hypothetical protein